MEIVIYMDAFFMVNFSMDLIILLILRRLRSINAAYFRCVAGAAAGAAGAAVLFLFPAIDPILRLFILYMPVTLGMLLLAFPYEGIGRLLLTAAGFYLISFCLGGFLSFCYYRMNFGYYLWELEQKKVFGEADLSFLLKAVMCTLLLLPGVPGLIRRFARETRKIRPVELFFQGKSIRGRGLLDSGNLLLDPIWGEPVIIGELSFVRNILTESQFFYVLNYTAYTKEEGGSPGDQKPPLSIIPVPYHSIGNSKGILPAFRIDEIRIGQNKKGAYREKAILAVYQGRISAKREYQIILHNEFT